MATLQTALAQALFAPGVSQGTVQTPNVTEASGIIASRQNPGVLWTHNDSGFPGTVFALSTNGALLAQYHIPSAFFGDFEDISFGPGPLPAFNYIYLGDIGDNTASRTGVSVFRFPEPAVYAHQASSPPAQSADAAQKIDLIYPDGHFNAEALMVDPVMGDLYIAVKLLDGSRIYRATRDQLNEGGPVAMTFVRQIGFFKVSGGDISADGRLVILRRGNTAALWNRRAGQTIGDALGGSAINVPVVGEPNELNGEAIGFHPSGLGYYTVSEGASQPIYFFRRVDSGTPRQPVVLIGPGETWRYRDLGSDEGVAWRQPAFDDSGWANGPAQLGYNQGDEQTTVSYGHTSSAKYTTTYFRKTFAAGVLGTSRNMALRVCFNDGIAVYLNGVEVLRQNLAPAAAFNQAANGSNTELQNYWQTFAISPALIQAGVNTIAVELHRQSAAGSDLSFDLQLVEGALDVNPISPPVDTILPKVAITSPFANAAFTNEVLTVRGTASDNVGVARVAWSIGGRDFETATGTKNWSAQIPLEVGSNLVSVVAFDARTNASVVVQRTFIRLVTSPLTLTRSGQGTVAPNLDGATLIVGRPYTVTATPAPRNLFAGWSGDLVTNAVRLQFLMQPHLSLRANFVTNQFIVMKGSYRGLFEETDHPATASSGSMTLSVTERGAYSAALHFGGKAVPFSGQFDLGGHSTKQIRFPGTNLLTVTLSLDLTHGTDLLTGEIAAAQWTSSLLAYRPAVFNLSNPAPAGRYTMMISGSTNLSGPAGHGIAGVVVAPNGSTTFSGTLADGTKIVQTAPLSQDGLCPLYQSPYGGQGSVLSWLKFGEGDTRSVTGRVSWIKPRVPSSPLYPAGFTNIAASYGLAYSVQPLTNFLASAGPICLVISGLALEAQTNCLAVTARNTLGGPGVSALKLDPVTGLWSGSYTNPFNNRPMALMFNLVLPAGAGYGFVLGTNVSAAVDWVRSP